jgi:hypothetical protein
MPNGPAMPARRSLDERALRRLLRVLTGAVLVVPVLVASAPAVAGHLITAHDIKKGAVTSKKLKDGAVTSPKLATGAVGSAQIGDGTVAGADLAPSAVGSVQLADGAVGSGELAPGGVGSAQLAGKSVGTTKIADGAVGPAQLAASTKIISSDWAYATGFVDTAIDNTAVHTAVVSAPDITAAVRNGADISVWMTYGQNTIPLPYTSFAGGKLSTISFQVQAGSILITRMTADNSNSVALSTVLQYRYTITPTADSAAASSHLAPSTSGAAGSTG